MATSLVCLKAGSARFDARPDRFESPPSSKTGRNVFSRSLEICLAQTLSLPSWRFEKTVVLPIFRAAAFSHHQAPWPSSAELSKKLDRPLNLQGAARRAWERSWKAAVFSYSIASRSLLEVRTLVAISSTRS